MDDLQFIVGRLAEDPFNLNIRAVDLDEKTPEEHLQLLNDVLASLNSDLKADVRVPPREDVLEQMIHFLLIHKCQLLPGDEEERYRWIEESIREGQKDTIFKLLHWALSNYEQLKKRCYLGKVSSSLLSFHS